MFFLLSHVFSSTKLEEGKTVSAWKLREGRGD
jgi:hypothetical protein